ncbi:MAG TPA: glycosyltransferase family 2 protein [Fimbriimonadaceae bacterium]|nr:glycosyltransferase family 2 protein [Fimbriimonadaceae bacterium]
MLSILIVNWNTRELLLACLHSIFHFPPSRPFEVIVVDNASKDGSAAAVAEAFPQVELIESDKNTGYARGNNLAFSRAKGDWLLTLNPDTEVCEATLDKAVEVLGRNPGCGALGARQIGPHGDVQRSVRGFPSLRGIVGDLTGISEALPRSEFGSYQLPDFDYDTEGPAPQPMGTFLLFRRSALEAVGDPRSPFDESFPIFFNEVDLLYRMAQAGWPAMYSPAVVIRHRGGESTKQVRKSMIWESHRSLGRFFRKHYRTPLNAPLLWLLQFGLSLAAWVRAKGYDAGFRA